MVKSTARFRGRREGTRYSYDGNGDLSSVTTPLSHVTSFGYNGLGVKTSRTDAMGRTTSYTQDNWERPVQINYPDGSVYTYGYDADSNLTGFSDPTGTTTRTYDVDNRLTSESKGTSTIKYTYDGTGQIGLLSSVTDQNGRTISYTYTARNELYTVADSAGTTTYTRDPDGNITGETLPNNATVTNTYDNDDRLSTVTNDGPGGTVLSSFSYAYNSDSQRTGVTENGGSAVNYAYNALHRLTEETRTGASPYTESFSYDPAGNRTSMTLNGNPINYTYDNDDELLSAGNNTYTYNANGDQITRDLNGVTSNLSYNDDDQLVSITTGSNTTSFAYDAIGRRVARDSGGTTTVFWYDGGSVILESQGGTFTGVYTYGASLIRRNGEYFQYDGSGSTRTITNSSGSQTASAIYDGYGNTVATSGSTSSPYLFAATSGYRNDNDDGLMLVGARYYDPAVGLFITRDTDLSQPAYQYCNDDPVNKVDPSGHDWRVIVGGLVVATGAVALVMLASPEVGAVALGWAAFRGFAIGSGIVGAGEEIADWFPYLYWDYVQITYEQKHGMPWYAEEGYQKTIDQDMPSVGKQAAKAEQKIFEEGQKDAGE
ncbi:MAG: hypothetical protein M1330_01855 [Armatimonadetes bacterium]|nr:hypothetical protein [Armatimonadota bacterium]